MNREVTEMDLWVENWKRYTAAVEEENKRRRAYNQKVHEKTEERLKPVTRKFLWWTWEEEVSSHYRMFQYNLENCFVKPLITPSVEGLLEYMARETVA